MSADEVRRVLALPLADDLLQHETLASLAYAGVDGSPRVVPVGFLWRDEKFSVCTATMAPKVAALRARPEVAISIHRSGEPPRMVLLRGRAEVDIVDGVAEEFLTASHKSGGPEDWAAFAEQQHGFYPQMARITITPHWAKLIDFETTMPQAVQHLMEPRS
jgi:hypothetical protein